MKTYELLTLRSSSVDFMTDGLLGSTTTGDPAIDIRTSSLLNFLADWPNKLGGSLVSNLGVTKLDFGGWLTFKAGVEVYISCPMGAGVFIFFDFTPFFGPKSIKIWSLRHFISYELNDGVS